MKKKLQNVVSIITILLACICCCFVVYQTHQCIEKYKAFPKSTEVYIAKASKYSYPDLSFCDSDFTTFEEELKKCNLTKYQYHFEFKWQASNGPEQCRDPKKLFAEITGKPSDIINWGEIRGLKNEDVTELNLEDPKLFEKKIYDYDMLSHCFSLKLPPNIEIKEIVINFHKQIEIYILSSKSSLNFDKSSLLYLGANEIIETDVIYDTFQVMDLDGQPCGEYDNSRDDCLHDEIVKVNESKIQTGEISSCVFQIALDEVGCTSPYHTNKSAICTDPVKGKSAHEIYFSYIYNRSFASRVCPKTCQFQVISFDNYEQKTSFWTKRIFKLNFEEFIKVSVSSPSYTFLTLIAEVGGYVGLFLGVSINQTFDLLSNLAMLLYSIFRKFSF